MVASLQILLGIVAGGVGFLQIANAPLAGCSSLLVSGFLILSAVDRLCQDTDWRG